MQLEREGAAERMPEVVAQASALLGRKQDGAELRQRFFNLRQSFVCAHRSERNSVRGRRTRRNRVTPGIVRGLRLCRRGRIIRAVGQ